MDHIGDSVIFTLTWNVDSLKSNYDERILLHTPYNGSESEVATNKYKYDSVNERLIICSLEDQGIYGGIYKIKAKNSTNNEETAPSNGINIIAYRNKIIAIYQIISIVISTSETPAVFLKHRKIPVMILVINI